MAYLAKKIEEAYILWFEASNQWIRMDKQQWFVFSHCIKNSPKEDIVTKLCKRFSLPKDYAINLVENISLSISNLVNPNFALPDFTEDSNRILSYKVPKSKTRKYNYNNLFFDITYGSPSLERYIHLPFQHLCVDNSRTESLQIDVFPLDNRYALRVNGDITKCFSADEPGQIKRLLFIELTNYFFCKDENDWLAFIHGSSLLKNNQTLILSSEGGSGKSTMAGLLSLNGFSMLSDDFIPIDQKSRRAYPFPAAISIKNDAIGLLQKKGVEFHSKRSKEMAYINSYSYNIKETALPIKAIVFIKYQKGADLNFETISALEALPHFLSESWVGNDMKRARRFINWFTKQQFYRLTYGNSSKAITILNELMETVG